ncbi:MAG: hypothetical protein IPM89_08515 [Candidatus Competibacteraceae bacterium]|nr:MAG: hypothetical protein IPM89_08515 [Candidatus Competibacteraceae bacterium]
MNIDLNIVGTIASIISLLLAIVFWRLADRQADKADRILNEIKDKMMSWQNDINSAAISLIQARPEIIAEKVSLEETKSNSDFMDRIADIVEALAKEADAQTAGYKLAIAEKLLEHQKSSIVAREQVKANLIAAQQGVTLGKQSIESQPE